MTVEQQALIKAAREWGYFSNDISALSELFRGRRILDVGMGAGPFAVAYIENGAAAYTGVDPLVASDRVRDFRSWTDPTVPSYHAFPFSADDIQRIYPNVQLYPGLLEDVASELKRHRLDFALMTSVTEHLRYPDQVIQTIWEVLDRDGILWSNHQNYYSWTGHHAQPRDVSSWDRDNAAHNAVVDWKHLEPTHPSYADETLNRIRLEDLRLIFAKYFEIQSWNAVVDDKAVLRLTPDIRKKWRKYSLAELLTRTVVMVGRRRDVPLDIDFTSRQFHHPSEHYLAERDYLHEDLAPFALAKNGVYFYKDQFLVSHSNNNYAALRVFERLNNGDRITVRKGQDRYTFTVAEIMRPQGSAMYLRLTETLPVPLQTTNYSDWTIEL